MRSRSRSLISIVIPCFQVAETIAETIDSALKQSYPHTEIILVDDGSTDQLSEVLQPFLTQHAKITYYRQDNQGVATARNVGAAHARGDYLLFLDGDDLLHSSYLDKAYACFENDPEVSLVYSNTRFFGEVDAPFVLPDYSYIQLLAGNCIPATALIKKAQFQLAGGYDTNFRYTEDWELWIRYLTPSSKVMQLKQVLFFYRKRASKNSLTDLNALQGDRVFDETRMRIYQKHYALYKAFGMGLENLHRAIAEESKYKDKYQNVWYRKWKNKIKGALKPRPRT